MDLDDRVPICPVCGEECTEIYIDLDCEVCGCNKCVSSRDAWEWLEEEVTNEEALKGDMAYDAWKEEERGWL